MHHRWLRATAAVFVLTGGAALTGGGLAGAATAPVHRIATVKPANFGLYDLTWYGTPFGKPTVYLADQSGIEAIDAKTFTDEGTFGQGLFVPFGSGAAACGPIGGIGPDGLLSLTVGGSNQLWAGDGHSSVRVFTLTSPGSGSPAADISTGGTCRADELSYDPARHLVLITNPSEPQNYVSLISVHADPTKDKVVAKISYPNAVGGLEQSVYDPNDGNFYLNVVQSSPASDQIGSVDVISSTAKRIIRSFPVIGCSPNGIALDPTNDQALLGCARNGFMIMDLRTGAIAHTITGVSGADEVTYDPVSQRFFAPSTTTTSLKAVLTVISQSGQVLQTVSLPANGFTHSGAAGGGKVFVPVYGAGIFVFNAR